MLMHWSEYGWGMGWSAWLFMVLFWALIILGLLSLFRAVWGHHRPTKEESALDILKKRYARGEINKEDFDKMKHDLAEGMRYAP